MAVNRYFIKKWFLMLTGKSVSHAPQNVGNNFVPDSIKGYFNDLTQKVIMQPELIEKNELPKISDISGKLVDFPVAIFQFGLGAYDLFLDTGEEKYLTTFLKCSKWATTNQMSNGAWDNFSCFEKKEPYSAMCQGEGCSLLVRAYVQTKDKSYLEYARRSIDFMLMEKKDGGTTIKNENGIVLLEYTDQEPVLNGWIFALFGIYDFYLATQEKYYKNAFDSSLNALENMVEQFDCGYWSYYCTDKRLASPFYHNLHIAQLDALLRVTNGERIKSSLDRFRKYNRNPLYKSIAFTKKALQKIKE